MNTQKIYLSKIFIVLLGWLISVCALAAEAGSGVNQPFTVRPTAPVLSVLLSANPSTGYQWVLIKYDQNLMEKPTSHYVPPKGGLIGATGSSVWQFKFKKSAFRTSQKTDVVLEYKRPWEESPGEKQVIQINVETE